MAAQTPSPPPVRNMCGSSSDGPYGPLADSGMNNPFFYHQFADDFDALLGAAGIYTLSGTGTAVHTPGDGGNALLSTTGVANGFESIQLPAASFTLPTTGNNPPNTSTSVKKLFYLARLALSDVVLSTFAIGLAATSATPFTTGVVSILDGIYFTKAASSAQINLVVVASAGNSPSGAGVSYTLALPLSSYNLVNGVPFDIGFYIDRQQNVKAFIGNPSLVGYAPQSGSGPVSAVTGVTLSPPAGPVASLQQSFFNQQFTVSPPPYLFTLANLNLTAAISNGVTAAVKTMTLDFHCVQKER